MSFDRQLIGTVLGSCAYHFWSADIQNINKNVEVIDLFQLMCSEAKHRKKPSARHVDSSYLLTFFLQRGPLQFVALYLRCQLSCGTIVQRHSRGLFNTEKLLYFTEKIWRNLEGKDKKIDNDFATLKLFLAKLKWTINWSLYSRFLC